jgi:hypothetical protein
VTSTTRGYIARVIVSWTHSCWTSQRGPLTPTSLVLFDDIDDEETPDNE